MVLRRPRIVNISDFHNNIINKELEALDGYGLLTDTETVSEWEALSLTIIFADPTAIPVMESVLPLTGETFAADGLSESAKYGLVPPLMVQYPV
jgi:hypothetical protein